MKPHSCIALRSVINMPATMKRITILLIVILAFTVPVASAAQPKVTLGLQGDGWNWQYFVRLKNPAGAEGRNVTVTVKAVTPYPCNHVYTVGQQTVWIEPGETKELIFPFQMPHDCPCGLYVNTADAGDFGKAKLKYRGCYL